MKDLQGTTIDVGDELVFIHSTRQSNLVIGTVTEVRPKYVVVQVTHSKPETHNYGRALEVGDFRKVWATATNSLILFGGSK